MRGGRDLVRSEPVDRRDGVSPKSPARFRVQGRGRRRVDVHINSAARGQLWPRMIRIALLGICGH